MCTISNINQIHKSNMFAFLSLQVEGFLLLPSMLFLETALPSTLLALTKKIWTITIPFCLYQLFKMAHMIASRSLLPEGLPDSVAQLLFDNEGNSFQVEDSSMKNNIFHSF